MYISGTSINSLPLAQGEYFSQQSSKLQWRIEGATAPGHHPKGGTPKSHLRKEKLLFLAKKCEDMTMAMTMKISLFDINHLNTLIGENKLKK